APTPTPTPSADSRIPPPAQRRQPDSSEEKSGSRRRGTSASAPPSLPVPPRAGFLGEESGSRGERGEAGGASGRGDGGDLHGDADLVADEHAAGLEGRVPGEAELLAGDLGGGGEADALVAEGVGRRAVVLDREGGGLGHAVDREVAVRGELLAAALDAGADEGP